MWQGKAISVIFPVYNEEEGILDAINDFLETGYVDEIVAMVCLSCIFVDPMDRARKP